MMKWLNGKNALRAHATKAMRRLPRTYAGLKQQIKRLLVRIRHRVPPGFRWITGLALMGGGVLGFLPVLGFWMIPLGIAVFLLDIKSLRNWWHSRGP